MKLESFLSATDSARALRTLSAIHCHAASSFVLTGGLATEMHLGGREIPVSIRPLNDIDFLVDSFDRIPPSIAMHVIFRHVHPADAPGKTLLQGVDPETGVRVDIFRAYGGTTSRAEPVDIHGAEWQMISIEDLTARAARLSLDLAVETPVPAKHARDFLRLLPHVNPERMQSVWIDHRKPNHPEIFLDAAGRLTQLIAARPELQIDTVYSQDLTASCARCHSSGPFILADALQVHSLLGYC